MKYVAFLDILGFKKKLNTFKTHNQAINYISKFSSIVYKEFKKLKETNSIKGYIVSDSVILYSTNSEFESLMSLISLINNICRAAFKENILIRGGLTKGHFDKVPASELKNLEKGLIVGDAYVNALNQEGFVKAIGVTISENVKEDIFKHNKSHDKSIDIDLILLSNISSLKQKNKEYYWFKYIDIDFLFNDDNLKKFIRMAVDSNYLPHYFNTLNFAVRNERNKQEIQKLFDEIVKTLNELGGNNEDLVSKFNKSVFVDKVYLES